MRKLSADIEVDDVASRGEDFEYTHDLRRLMALARIDIAADAPFDISMAVAHTEYAVPLRYEDLLDAEPLDRRATVTLLNEVEAWAESALAEGGE